ncbi:bifunctional phosphoribosylaminoimidazolecarboxamide formyltransferase/IMP cyclohydrolase, partial [Francisella tularensis subsp. holarctica]|nr:bifunctional phosphoribosylaminoimidazolecarboxamide formyltransferase/IMP cyclohydrolase [Francisella tularensis subsp. holarctica]
KLQVKELSYINLYDADGSFDLFCEYSDPYCAIIKHANPCCIASGKNAFEARTKALACDPNSAFGGIVAFNCEVDKEFDESQG